MAKKKQKRRYWVIPDEGGVFSGGMNIRTFLKKAGYEIKDKCDIVYGSLRLGRVMADDTVCVDYNKSEDLNALERNLDLIELLDVNGVEYYEPNYSRKELIDLLKRKTSHVIRRLEKLPEGKH